MKKVLSFASLFMLLFTFVSGTLYANEVGKGKIPQDQLSKSYKKLPWGSPIWDVDDAIAQLKTKEKMLWIDTRPGSFFKKGTVRDAMLLTYNQSSKKGNQMTQETLAAAIAKTGLSKDKVKIAFFCQGPK